MMRHSGKEQLSYATLLWKGLRFGHMVHNHASPSSLLMRVQSPNVAGPAGLRKINHPYALCEKSHVDLKPGVMRFGGIPTDERSHSSSS